MSSKPPSPAGYPVAGHTIHWARDLFKFLDRGIEEVGDIFRAEVAGREVYILGHPEFFERALMTQQDAFRKSEDFAIAFGENLNAVEGEQWERQNEALQEFFFPGRIRSYADDMVEIIDRRVDGWADGDQISLHEQMKAVALEILYGTLFDRPLDPDGDEELRWAANSLNDWFKPSSWVLPNWVPTPARRRFKKGRERLENEARRLLAEREREGGSGDDLLSTMVQVRQSDSDLITESEMIDQVAGLTFAGHDTTALTLSFAWHRLGGLPEVRERFHAELADVLDGERPTMDDVSDLEVTRNIVNETMRRHTSVHSIPRTTTKPIEAHGYEIPAEKRVFLSIYRVHRHPDFWEDPDAFRPERWNDTSPQEKGYAFVPFGAGPRSCIGQRFSNLEAVLVLARIGQKFELQPQTELEFAPEMTSQPADSLPAKIDER
jgi:cytochrome P450